MERQPQNPEFSNYPENMLHQVNAKQSIIFF